MKVGDIAFYIDVTVVCDGEKGNGARPRDLLAHACSDKGVKHACLEDQITAKLGTGKTVLRGLVVRARVL